MQSMATEILTDARLSRIRLFGIPLDNVTMTEAIAAILQRLEGGAPQQACFVNADCVNLSYRHPNYLETLQQADLVFADGIGMRIAAAALGHSIQENLNGTDLFPCLCEALERAGKSLFLLGARPGVADEVRGWVARQFPSLHVAGCHHGYFSPDEQHAVIRRIADSGADLLLVAFGAPRQDLWIRRHLGDLGVGVAMGVGGLFDFYSGRTPRAPRWMRHRGLEWLYRLYQEPGRLWKRYLIGNPRFLLRLAREMRGGSHWGKAQRAVAS
jgi:N-acetylglucosaminyldiphosphoundecaprenol N-acetyl-beta-D-mannosaminyltransferase